MPTSATGRTADGNPAGARSQSGFTLFELLVVIAIVSVLLGTIVMAVRPPSHDTEQRLAEKAAVLVRLALDEAFFNRRNFGIEFSTRRMQLFELDPDTGAWSDVAKPQALAAAIALEGYSVSLEVEQRTVTMARSYPEPQPQAFILSSGETTPFRLTISNSAAEPISLSVDPYGKLGFGSRDHHVHEAQIGRK